MDGWMEDRERDVIRVLSRRSVECGVSVCLFHIPIMCLPCPLSLFRWAGRKQYIPMAIDGRPYVRVDVLMCTGTMIDLSQPDSPSF